MDLGGRIIIVFIILVASIILLDLKEPVHNFLYSVLTLPEPWYVRNVALYQLVKLCIFLIAIVGIVRLLSRR